MREPPSGYGVAHILHQILIEMDVMLGHQHRTQYFLGLYQMMQIGAVPSSTDRAIAIGIKRAFIFGKTGITNIERATQGKRLAVPA